MANYLDNILRSGHGSVLEHSVYTFAIEGVSRVFTAEMNRHRAGVAISEASLRYIRFDDIPFWMPHSLLDQKEDSKSTVFKKDKSRRLFARAFLQMEDNYKELCDIWKEELAPDSSFKYKKQITSMMRRIIGMGVATGGVWTMNIRALRHIIAMRATEAAEEEICLVAGKIAKIMIESEPMLFCDWKQTEDKFWTPVNWKI